jgi:3-oxoadipate enol-lactonase
MSMQRHKTPAVEIAYRVDGGAGLPWIVLSNSLATDHRMWEQQMPLLLQSFRVLRYDTRGHGASSAPSAPYSFGDLAGDVLALMDHLQIERASFMGLSLGGMTGLELALRHGGRFDRFVCADARADCPDAYRQIWPGNIERARAGGMEAVADGTLERWFSPQFRSDPANAPVLAVTREQIVATAVEGYVGCASALLTLDFLKDLGRIDKPFLYVVGETDPAAPVAVMRGMAEATPGSTFEIIPVAAHLANVEAPDAFNAILSQWLAPT